VGASKIIIKATKKFKTIPSPGKKPDSLKFFLATREKSKILHSVMYACLIAKTVLTQSPLPDHCASVKEHLGEPTFLNAWRKVKQIQTIHPLNTQHHVMLTLIMWELIF